MFGFVDLILWDAVDAHGGDGCEHHSDGKQTEELAGDGVSWVLQSQPQALPDVPVTHFLEMLHIPAMDGGRQEVSGDEKKECQKGSTKVFFFFLTCLNPISRPQKCLCC